MSDEIRKEIVDFLPTLRAFARSLAYNDADDLVQTTVMKALTNLHRFQKDTNLKAWLFTILKNAAMNEFRRHKTHNNEAYYIRETDLIAPDNPEEGLIAREIISKIDTLPEDQQKTLSLIVFHDMKYHEVAKHTKTNEGTVKSRLSRGREKLRQFAK